MDIATPQTSLFKRKVGTGLFVGVVIVAVLVGIGALAAATKAGYIKNYFNISFLTPYNEAFNQQHPFYWPTGSQHSSDGTVDFDKPVIYLYPPLKQNVSVQFETSLHLKTTYPSYGNGWNVFAYPNSTLVNVADGRLYSYLFWDGEGVIKNGFDLSTGFVIEGNKTSEFLQEKLGALGLTPHEYNEFIVYWLPKMINNKYNVIHFATKSEYADQVPLNITPRPDSTLRVFMVFKGLDAPTPIVPQELPSFKRNGFTVVEWGGSEL